MSKNEINMTEGNALSLMTEFSLPLLIGGLLQQMYSMADAVIAGRFIGSYALAAIANAYYVVFLVTILFTGISRGAAIVISQFYGADNKEKLRLGVDTVFCMTIAGGIICTVLGCLFSDTLMRIISTPKEVLKPSASYLSVIFVGMLATFGYSNTASLLNAVGNSRVPLVMLAVSSVLNVILDILFVAVGGMKLEGLALATVISQIVSLIGCIIYISKNGSIVSYRIKGVKFDKKIFYMILRLGVPTGLQNSLMIVSMMVIQKQINGFGVAVMAGRGIESKIEHFLLIPLDAIQTGVMTFVGQNIGAGKKERLSKGLQSGLIMGGSVTLIFWFVMLFWMRPIFGLFSDDSSAIYEAIRCMRIIAPLYAVYSLSVSFQAFFRGVGDTMFPLILTIITQFIYRISMIDIFVDSFKSPTGIWVLYTSSWVLMFILDIIYYKIGYWKKYFTTLKACD